MSAAVDAFEAMSSTQQHAAAGAVGVSMGAALLMSPRMARVRGTVQRRLDHYFQVWQGAAYNDKQRAEMRHIHAHYQAHFRRDPNGGLLPAAGMARPAGEDEPADPASEAAAGGDQFRCLLAMNEEGRLVHFSGRSAAEVKLLFMPAHWIQGMGTGFLRPVLEPVVQRICSYLKRRLDSKKLFRKGNSPKDPVSVVLCELMVIICEWTHENDDAFRAPEASLFCTDEGSRTVVDHTIDFLRVLDTQVYQKSEGRGHSIFKYIIHVLDGSVPAMLKQCERSYQLKTYLETLLRAQRMALLHLVEYLWFVLREPVLAPPPGGVRGVFRRGGGGGAGAGAVVQNEMFFDPRVLLAAHQAVYDETVACRTVSRDVTRGWTANVQTVTGFMLLQLVCSRPFHSVFPDWFRPVRAEQLAVWNPQLRSMLGLDDDGDDDDDGGAGAGAPASPGAAAIKRSDGGAVAAAGEPMDATVFLPNPFTHEGRAIVPQLHAYPFWRRVDCSPIGRPSEFFEAAARCRAASPAAGVPATGVPAQLLNPPSTGERKWATRVINSFVALHGVALDIGNFACVVTQANAVASLGAEMLLLGNAESVRHLEKSMELGTRLVARARQLATQLSEMTGRDRPPRVEVSHEWEQNRTRAEDTLEILEQDLRRCDASIESVLNLTASRGSQHMADHVREELLVFMAMSAALNVRVKRYEDADAAADAAAA